MPFQAFQQRANQLGQARQPFFFIIDFEQQKPIICALSQTEQQGIYFSLAGKSNQKESFSTPQSPVDLRMQPCTLAEYARGFEYVQGQLQMGNTYLLNLTHATPIQINYSLAQLFQQAKAPYKLLLADQFVCFSPECFVRTERNQIFTYPMKGTINANLPNAAQRLLEDQKELQEHYTIVDLMRNDLAMVASQIEVKRFRYMERIETARGAILQTSSEICGNLAPNWQGEIGDMLAQLLPAGSISGAPKEKTVQIIQQAEQRQRGYYTGVFGIFDGENLDSAVAIRFIEQRQQQLFFHSGGGITTQSQLEQEYQELLAKIYFPQEGQ